MPTLTLRTTSHDFASPGQESTSFSRDWPQKQTPADASSPRSPQTQTGSVLEQASMCRLEQVPVGRGWRRGGCRSSRTWPQALRSISEWCWQHHSLNGVVATLASAVQQGAGAGDAANKGINRRRRPTHVPICHRGRRRRRQCERGVCVGHLCRHVDMDGQLHPDAQSSQRQRVLGTLLLHDVSTVTAAW